jgi:hypothetical protein
MKTKTEALAKMVCDNKCCKDPKAFNAKRDELIKAVDELGAVCKGKDDAKINPVFEKVHQAYINLATMCK